MLGGVLGSIQPLVSRMSAGGTLPFNGGGFSAREPQMPTGPIGIGGSTRQFFEDAGYSESRARTKAEEVRRGTELRRQRGIFPENRTCQDLAWVLLFVVVLVVMLGLSIYYQVRFVTNPPTFEPRSPDGLRDSPVRSRHDFGAYESHRGVVDYNDEWSPSEIGYEQWDSPPRHRIRHLAGAMHTGIANSNYDNTGPLRTDEVTSQIDVNKLVRLLITTSVVAGIGGLLVVYPFLLLAHKYANTVVHVALILGPVSMIISGVSMLAACFIGGELGAMLFISGFICVALGLCSLALVLFRWGQLIPFTVRVVRVVAGIAKKYPALLLAPLLGAFVGNLWVIMSSLVFIGLASDNYHMMQGSTNPDVTKVQIYAAVFVMALVLYWGVEVARCLSHVTICGVYGRWYFGRDAGRSRTSVVLSSLKVAFVTSFGSICLGTFLVAFIRGIEAVARQIEVDARREDNRVLQCVAIVVRCVLGCIGDILEYFNEWAYIQCAIRGVGFLQATKITYSLCTIANIQYIISSWLIGNVVWLGALFCASAGAVIGALLGMTSGTALGIQSGFIIGFAAAFASGRSAMCVVSSGSKTLLTCWAESPETLKEKEDAEEAELAEDFERPRRWVTAGGILMNSRPEDGA